MTKKHRVILTKDGEVYSTENYTHETLLARHGIKGRDWNDWVRIVVDSEGNFQVKGRDMPQWLERQYGYFKRLIKERLKDGRKKHSGAYKV